MLTIEKETEWLAGLKPGDEAAHGTRSRYHITKVTKVTATQVVCGRSRFNRKSGKELGTSGFHSSWLLPVTDQMRAATHRRNVLYRVSKVAWDLLPTETLEEVLAMAGEDRV